MDHHSPSGRANHGVHRGIVHPTADPCYLGYDQQQRGHNEQHDEHHIRFESNTGSSHIDYHYSCCGLFLDVFNKAGFLMNTMERPGLKNKASHPHIFLSLSSLYPWLSLFLPLHQGTMGITEAE